MIENPTIAKLTASVALELPKGIEIAYIVNSAKQLVSQAFRFTTCYLVMRMPKHTLPPIHTIKQKYVLMK